jgi:hypothetical protein
MHLHELGMALAVCETPVGIDEPEAAVAHDAGVCEVDLVRIDDVQRLHGRDADADDPALHLANLAIAAVRTEAAASEDATASCVSR